jgi:hypothetical protein
VIGFNEQTDVQVPGRRLTSGSAPENSENPDGVPAAELVELTRLGGGLKPGETVTRAAHRSMIACCSSEKLDQRVDQHPARFGGRAGRVAEDAVRGHRADRIGTHRGQQFAQRRGVAGPREVQPYGLGWVFA